jgi:putative ABC transport system permease protein
LRRPLARVGLGILAGGALATALMPTYRRGVLSVERTGLLAAYTVLVLGVCLLACIVPTRRALRLEPTEALRADA